jgi:3'-phosphoadenosine 5'-phosphosulfate sulfotransferase (PAPS reductase)/FAD synthetase
MTRSATSVRVLLYINHQNVDWDDLYLQEFEAIVREIRKMWPPDMEAHVWFDVEAKQDAMNGRWETIVRVVCYHMPVHNKNDRAEIPRLYIDSLVGRKFRIFPITDIENDISSRKTAAFRRLDMQLVEVVYVIE